MSVNFRKIIGALALLTLFTASYAQEKSERKEIVGYYPNWQQYKRGGMFHQKNLDFSKYTIIEYAFMGLDENGNIYLVDPWGDNKILAGEIDWSLTTDEEDPVYIPNSNLVGLAHKSGAKVMVSLGGWTLSTNFPIVAADPVKRARFAESCVEVCRKYDFDGIDIDWEFPGASPGNGCIGGPEDKENLNLMFDVIRDSLDVYEKEVGQKMLLTAAFHSVPYLAQQIDWEHTSEVLDYINLFGYDFYGAWYKEEAIPQSPLYPPAEGHGDFGVNQADGFLLLTEVYGVPAEKIILGIGFYGRSIKGMKGGAALYAPHDGAVDIDNFPLHEGSPAYFEIIEKYKEYNVMWDEDMKVPYMLGKKDNSFVGYDDLVSVQYKAAFICQQNAAGCLIWEISQDIIEKPIGSGKIGGTPLIDVINEVFENYEQTGDYSAYGNPIELRDTEELIESYHRRDAQIESKQEGYSQDEQPAAGHGEVEKTQEEVEKGIEDAKEAIEKPQAPVEIKAPDTTPIKSEVEKAADAVDATVNDAQKEEVKEYVLDGDKVEKVQEEVVTQPEAVKDAVKDITEEESTITDLNVDGDENDNETDAVSLDKINAKHELRNGDHLFDAGDLDILFAVNSAKLSAAAKQNVRATAKFIVANKIPITLTGHSSTDGDAKANLVLAQKRTYAVQSFLVEMVDFYAGVNKININANDMINIAKAKGETTNYGSNLAHNRRVSIHYVTK